CPSADERALPIRGGRRLRRCMLARRRARARRARAGAREPPRRASVVEAGGDASSANNVLTRAAKRQAVRRDLQRCAWSMGPERDVRFTYVRHLGLAATRRLAGAAEGRSRWLTAPRRGSSECFGMRSGSTKRKRATATITAPTQVIRTARGSSRTGSWNTCAQAFRREAWRRFASPSWGARWCAFTPQPFG